MALPQPLHIFRKDLTHLWPETLFVLILFVFFVFELSSVVLAFFVLPSWTWLASSIVPSRPGWGTDINEEAVRARAAKR